MPGCDSSYPERLMLGENLAQNLLRCRSGCMELSQKASREIPSPGLEASMQQRWIDCISKTKNRG